MIRNVDSTSYFFAFLTLLIGISVLIGWHTENHYLIQIQPSFAPMQYNTALGFGLCSSGLLFLDLRKLILSNICGLLIFAIGTTTLIQYVFEINLGIDQLFMEPYITVKTSHPGRMAPNTAICFSLVGMSISMISFAKYITWYRVEIVAELLLSLVVGMGVVSLTGYLLDLESAYGWGSLTRMAVHTSIGFLTAGIGVIAFSIKNNIVDKQKHIPIISAITLLILTIYLWNSLNIESENNAKRLVVIQYEKVANLLVHNIQQDIDSLERLSSRWNMGLYKLENEWVIDAKSYIDDKKELLALEWVDKFFIKRWVVAAERNNMAVDFDLKSDPITKNTFDAARASRQTKITRLINLDQGVIGFISASPVFKEEKFDGFIVGVFDAESFINTIFKEQKSSGMEINFFQIEEDLSNEKLIKSLDSGDFEVRSKIVYKGLELGTKIVFNRRIYSFPKTVYPEIIGGSGVLLSFLIGLLIHYNQKSKVQSERLKKSEIIVNSSSDMMALLDREYTYLNANSSYLNGIGKSSEQVIGKSVSAVLGKDFFENVVKGYGDRCLRGEKVNFQSKSSRLEKVKTLDVNYYPYISNNKIIGFIVNARDITKRKEAEESLRLSEKRFKAIFEDAPLGVALINSITGGINEVNRRYSEIVGRSKEEITKIDWMSITHPDDLQEDLDNMEALNAGKINGFHMNKRIIKQDGTYVWVNLTVAALTVKDQAEPRHLAMIEDITERKQSEESLRLSEERLIHSEKLSAIGKLSASMAHEINNPICGIRNVLERIYEKADLKDKEKTGVNLAVKECDRIGDLVKDLSDFHRPSPGRPIKQDINMLIESILALSSKEISKKHIQLEVNLSSDLPQASIIPDQIKQVLLNLINNAQDSIDGKKDGKISITTELNGSTITIQVKDNGCGIPDQIRDHIFDPFVTTKSEVKGVGLGLSISHGIIKAHGGEVLVDSVEGEGSSFSVVLPCSKEN